MTFKAIIHNTGAPYHRLKLYIIPDQRYDMYHDALQPILDMYHDTNLAIF